jgi:hypothetical protein
LRNKLTRQLDHHHAAERITKQIVWTARLHAAQLRSVQLRHSTYLTNRLALTERADVMEAIDRTLIPELGSQINERLRSAANTCKHEKWLGITTSFEGHDPRAARL